MNHAKADSEELMNAALPLAERLLTEQGEFYPYGMSMKPSGEIVSVAGYDGRERPPSQDIIDLLVAAFHADAHAGKVKATALVYDILVKDPKTNTESDAIAVALDHRDNYSVVVLFPYSLVSGQLRIGDPIAEKGKDAVFRSK